MKKSLARLSRKKGKMIFSLNTRLTVLLLFSLLCAFPSFTSGQPGNPTHHPPGHGMTGNQKPQDTALDSGLAILTLMGLALMAQKNLTERRRNKK